MTASLESSTFLQCISLLFVAISLIYTGIQVSFLIKSHKDDHDWNRRVATQNALREFNDSVNRHYLQVELNFMKRMQPIPIKEINDAFAKKPELLLEAHKLLNQYETFARGIYQGIYDKKIIENARKGSMQRSYNAFKEYIVFRRNELGNHATYIEFENLIEEWSKESKKTGYRNKTGEI